MIDIKATTYQCTCNRCGTRFTLASKIGPARICDTCWRAALAFIFGTN